MELSAQSIKPEFSPNSTYKMPFGLTDTHAILQAIVNVKKQTQKPLQIFALHSDFSEMQKEPVQHVCLVLQCLLAHTPVLQVCCTFLCFLLNGMDPVKCQFLASKKNGLNSA